MDRRRYRPEAVLILLVVLGAGCGLFKPRTPRPGIVTPPLPCRVRSAPDSVLANMVVHYGKASDCYPSGLADSTGASAGFQFVPDPQDYVFWTNPPAPNPFDGWNKGVESKVSQSIANKPVSIVVSLDSTYANLSRPDANHEIRYYYYHVTETRVLGDSTRYQGQAELTMLLSDTQWFLETFKDHRDASGLSTWGSYRAGLRKALGI